MQIITTHIGTDFDALASMVAARKLYPGASICFPGSLSREVKLFMHLYGKLIPHVKVEEVDLDKVTRLIIVDTRWIDRIGVFGELVGRKSVEIHIYDHHPSHCGDIEGDGGICKEVGANISILTKLIKERNIFISPAEASLFTLGIYEDTGSLRFSSTTPLDLEMASFLLSKGASLELVSSFLNRGLTEKQTFVLNDFLRKAKTRTINGIEVVMVVTEVEEFVGGLSLPLHKFIDLKNIRLIFALIKTKDRVYMIARSRVPSVNVAEILSAFGGGGHNFAASALIKGRDVEEIEQELYQILKKRLKPSLTVREVMSRPVITVSPHTSIKEAKEILQRYLIEVLPVVEKGKVVGIVPRERIERLAVQNSSKITLKSYLSPKFVAISPDVSIRRAQEVMMEEEVGRLFVMEDDRILGVLTGSDLLEAFHRGKEKGAGEKLVSLEQLLKERVPARIRHLMRQAGKVAHQMGYRAFIVGGFVRDLLLGIENLDIDLVIEGEGIPFALQFARRIGAKVVTHREFGTATLTLSDGFKLDIATSRKEFYPEPAALPQVKPASLREDLLRRDFTLNAMAIDLGPSNFGKLIDFFGGQNDLMEGKVRVLHEKSFIDDPTRVFRAVRFEQRYGFLIEEETERLIREVLEKRIFHRLTRERIKEELIQILEEDKPEKAIRRMQDLGVLEAIYPGMRLTPEGEKVLDRLVDVFAWVEILSEERPRKWLTRLLVLLEPLSEDKVKDFCQSYRFTREERSCIIEAKSKVKGLVEKLRSPEYLAPSFIYYLLEPLPQELLLLAMAKTEEKLVKKRIFFYLSRLKDVRIEVDGQDLKRMGYRPSPKFRQILNEVKKARLDGKVRTKEEEISYIREKFPDEAKEDK